MSASDVKKKTRRPRRKFTAEFKDGAVKLVLGEGKNGLSSSSMLRR
jgi:transposase-like protein